MRYATMDLHIKQRKHMAQVLIIEDDELIRRMYQQIFSFRGHDVAVAENGETGLEKAREVKPTMILLDIMMPKLNGLELIKRLKALPELKHIPVIVLTNLMGSADAEAALAAGAVKFVCKSDYSPKEVAEIVEEVLEGYTRDAIPST